MTKKTTTKSIHRIRRHHRVRARIIGTASRPRVAVFRSSQHVFIQVIDDEARKTIVSMSDEAIKKGAAVNKELTAKVNKAFQVGQALAEELKTRKITEAVFDRGGFKYHGRVKAVAEGLRNGGIQV